MGKSAVETYHSFNKNGGLPTSPRNSFPVSLSDNDTFDQHSSKCSQDNIEKDVAENVENHDLSSGIQVANDIDEFTSALSSIHDKSSVPSDVPNDSIETFSKIIESTINRYNSGDKSNTFSKMKEDDMFFMEAVKRISKLTNSLSEFSSNTSTTPPLNRTSLVLQRAMAFLEEEFRSLLEDSINCTYLGESDDYPGYPAELVAKMQRIANTMITGGYEAECCQVYSIHRRNTMKIHIKKLEFEIINMEDASRMPWESLEVEISRWIKTVKTCSETIFPGEKKLGESVFSDHQLVFRSLFSNLTRNVVVQLLDFAEATSMVNRSAEKLFKFLDMYEAVQTLIQTIGGDESCSNEIAATANRIGESVMANFCALENSIKGDVAGTPVPGGAIHPLTRYVMNYLKYACEYKDALEKVFEKHRDHIPVPNSPVKDSDSPVHTSQFSIQVITVMDLLDSNLQRKSSLYRDPALRDIFLMNNGRYILQKVKGSTEIRAVMGDNWCRRRSTVVRQYHKNYQRETWNRVLQSLNQEGLQVNGKVNKPMLKERFKIFTTIFDEIHRAQSTWVVSDPQLQSELRISISAVVIPAYRSFVGRFKQYLEGKHVEKYIKYQPEDIETLIEELFEGNTASMARRR